MRRADQQFVDAHSRRHARDERDGAAEIFGLQHPGLLLLARHHRAQLQDRGRHLARHQAAGAQAVDAFVHVEGMGQRQHRVLGRGVGRARHFGDVAAGPGRDVDDGAVLLLAHRRQHRAQAIEHAVEVDLNQLVPALQFHVLPAALGDIDAGIVHQQVDPAVLRDDLIGGLLGRSGDRHVQRDGFSGSTRPSDLRDHGIEGVLAPARDHHRPAVGRQRLGAGLPDPAAPACHPGHAFPVFGHANCLRCFIGAVFANPALGFDRPCLTSLVVKPCSQALRSRKSCMNQAANANLFSRLFDGLDDPKRLAIETHDGGRISYGDLIARAGQMANVLVPRGVKPGDRVAVQVEKSVANIVLYLATVRAGAVYLPLNTAYTLNELDYFIGDAEPSLVVCDPSKADGLAPIAAKVKAKIETLGPDGKGSLTDAADKASSEFTTVSRANDDLAAILYTSGTTGRSKGAMLTHDNLASNSLSLVGFWRFTDKDVLIHALPIYHTHGLFVATNVTLFARASMIFLPKLDPDLIIKLMARATVLMGVPTFYTRLLQNAALSRETTQHMRLFISGSAPLLAETHREWSARTGHAVLERYGMTETNMNTSNPYDGERVPGAVGFPLPGVSVRVTDPETAKELPRDEIGMIEVKGPNVFKGYWRMPEKTKAEFRDDGFFITGDLGKIDAKGYVHILGRGKDLVISGGFNVYPKEIESEIDAMPGVIESAVIGVPHADFGEGVTAVLVCNKGADVTEAAVLKALDGRLAKFKMPKRVFVVDELPRNTMGKVQKNVLRDTYKDLYAKK